MQIKTFTKLGLGLAVVTALTVPAHANEFPDISRAELLKQIQAKKVTVIDVNGTESWKSGRIPGALNYDVVKGKLQSKLPANKKALVVAYCGNEYCGAYKKAATEAKKLGYTNVKHFSGGIAGWKKAGAPIQKS